MSVAPPTLIAPDDGAAFASNNPFRRRASQVPPLSPSLISPTSQSGDRTSVASSQRPQSRNPFLDVFDDLDDMDSNNNRPRTSHKYSFDSSTEQRPQFTGATLDLFNNLSVTANPNPPAQRKPSKDMDRMKPPPPRQQGNGGPRPPISSSSNPRSHNSRPSDPLDIFNKPMNSTDRRRNGPPPPVGARKPVPSASTRPRRNSDSSVMDAHEIDKERERRERRKREEARRVENGRDKDKAKERRKKGTPLDVIDKLDVTGIYGSGLFHHDGPFDACNPHRNKNTRRAPMQAFPADSANNALTGFGPIQKTDHSDYFGNRDPEAFSEWSARRPSEPVRPDAKRATSFDPVARVEPIHGDETLGLGTSTFLDGAPASRKAIESKQKEEAEDPERQAKLAGSGIARKKSLAQKIRSISTSRGGHTGPDRDRRTPNSALNTPSLPEDRISPGLNKKKDHNPFFNDYDAAYEKKSEQISVATRDRAPSSPKKPYGILGKDEPKEGSSAGGSLMKRVRSLSKPKKRDQLA